jgi:hypothetical protein
MLCRTTIGRNPGQKKYMFNVHCTIYTVKQIGLHLPSTLTLVALSMLTDAHLALQASINAPTAGTASPDYRPCTCEDVLAAASMSFTSEVIPAAPDDVHALKMISQALEMTWQVSRRPDDVTWQALGMLCQALQIYVEGTPDDVAGTPDVVSGTLDLR